MAEAETLLSLKGVSKTFTMHLRGGIVLPVFDGLDFDVKRGECVVLAGPSGIGKSSILKMVYGNYRCEGGEIQVVTDAGAVDVASANPRAVLALRRDMIGYISQFLRVIPRVGALDIVAEAAVARGVSREDALEGARALLARLNVPERLWDLPPATFSGGEQQRINLARGFIGRHPVLLLDEPTASLDAKNREVVVDLIGERKAEGAAVLGIFHDADVREQVADRLVDVTRFAAGAAA